MKHNQDKVSDLYIMENCPPIHVYQSQQESQRFVCLFVC